MKKIIAVILAVIILCTCGAAEIFADAAGGIAGFRATAGDKKVSLRWNDSGAESYTVSWKRTAASSWKIAGNTKKTAATVSGLQNGVSYDFKVSVGKKESPVVTVTAGAKKAASAKKSDGGMSGRTTAEIVADMGIGINLGNTFDSTGDWFEKTVSNQETAWGSPIITEEMIKGYADAGFGVMRLPVSWTLLADSKGNIPKEFMDRIEEVVGWILDSGMYCILNTHHDDWPAKFEKNFEGTLVIYENIWKQIAERFKDYGEGLMFESMNEVGFDSVWNQYGGTTGKSQAFNMFNKINQKFVDTIRASGGNNPERHLLIASYWTNIDHACAKEFKMPNDPAGRCAISVHYYTPAVLCLIDSDVDWGKARTSWGTDADYAELKKYMDMMDENFAKKGIPVIIGEYGCFGDNKSRSVIEKWTLAVASAAAEKGFCPVLWDTPGGEYDREHAKFSRPDFIKKLTGIK